jgi:hypothetical protein
VFAGSISVQERYGRWLATALLIALCVIAAWSWLSPEPSVGCFDQPPVGSLEHVGCARSR